MKTPILRPVPGNPLKFFTSAEIADVLKMNPQVINRKLQAGEIAGYKLGKDWRVSEVQLLEYLERHSNQRRATTPEARVVGTFFEGERLKAIPVARAKRLPVLRELVARLERGRIYSEAELSRVLAQWHPDVATLRREFVACKLMVRKDGKYRVVGQV
ncbi:MAG: DUF2087 domain-containing protein [Bacteriovoracia bacterium]